MSTENAQIDLSPRQVADAIGVSVSSLKRWCDRGDLAISKTAGGHRRIARAEVIRFLRERGFDAERPDLLGLPAGSRLAARDEGAVLPQVIAALRQGDEPRLVALLTGLYLAKRSFVEISDGFLKPAFEAIGSGWEHGEIEVYEEHRAVVVARGAIEQLRSYLPRPDERAPLAVSATLSGDPYLLPISLIELVMREASWNAMVLGPSHPVDTLCRALAKLRPRLVCVSVSFVADEATLIADVAALYETASKLGIALAIGGGSMNEALRRSLRCTAHCSSMADLLALAHGLEPAVAARHDE